MADLTTLLNQRVKKSDQASKMAAMAQQSASGNLTSFAGVFSITDLNDREKESIASILKQYSSDDQDIDQDLNNLILLTSEVKAINNQAALLHGERIKKAHNILINYREGAFTAWLMAAYGNRQTPYNLMQYFEFYESLPKNLRPQLDAMPRQAVYTLASRSGSFEKKQEIVKRYNGETKTEILHIIRTTFPLETGDRRRQNTGESIIATLEKLSLQIQQARLSSHQRKKIRGLLDELQQYL